MYALIDAAIDRFRTMVLLLAFILVMGVVAYGNIAKESNPDVKIPIIYISMVLEGISPEDAERLLIRPMEKKLSSLEGIKTMKAQATEGFASVVMEFDAGFDSEKALRDVRVKVDEARPELPSEVEEPTVNEVNLSLFPVVNVILTGDVPERTLVQVSRALRDKLENISEVLEAKLVGDREEVLEIVVDPLALEAYGLSPAEVFATVQGNNILVPAGEVDTGRGSYAVKLPGLIENAFDLRDVPVKVSGEAVVTLKDVASIKRSFKDVKTYARVNGKRAIVLGVSKRSGANIIETVDKVRGLIEAEKHLLPAGVQVTFSQDTSNETKDMLSDLENGLFLAVLLVLIIMIATMGTRAALLVSLAIPGSFLIGILTLKMMGMTLNVVVLFSLILAVGMLVDAAIVVCEYADRLMIDGLPREQAYPQAAKRMLWPVIAATITTKVVFLPLLFWPGMVGEFMKYMPITLLVTLTGSLLMALVFVPTLGARVGSVGEIDESHIRSIRAGEEGDLNQLEPFSRSYVRLLDKILDIPGRFFAAVMVVIVAIYVMFIAGGPGQEFFPVIEPQNANVQIRARGNLSIEEKDALVREVEERIADMQEIKVRYASAGKVDGQDAPEDVVGNIQLEFTAWNTRRTAAAILQDIRNRTLDIPGILIDAAKQENGPPVGKPVQLEFGSRFPELIAPEVERFTQAIKEMGGFVDIQDDRPTPQIEWELTVNRELAGRFGVDVRTIGNVVKLVTNGIKAGEYRPDDADDSIDIIVRFPESARNIAQLDRLRIMTNQGLVPASTFVTRTAKPKVGMVKRVDGMRVVTVKADLQEGVLADDKVKQVKKWFADNGINPEVAVTFRGEDEEQQKNAAFLGTAFIVAIFAMLLIMITQFNSIFSAVIIMSAVFLSTGGILFGLLVTWQPFGVVMCGVGVITLAGIVVNNNIIFIDTFDMLRKGGMPMREALLRTGAQRLRPILLTSITTVLGLVPMVLGMNINFITREVTFGAPSSQWWNQLSTAIAGGLTFATILTLFFTPCLLLLGERFGKHHAG